MWIVNKRYLHDSMFVHPRGVEGIVKTEADEHILAKSGTGRDYRVLNLTVSTFNDNTTSAFYSSVGGYHAAKLRRYQELVEEHIAKEIPQIYTALGEAKLDTVRMMAENSRFPIYDLSEVNTDALYPVLNMLNTRWFILGAGEKGEVKLPVENTAAYGNAWFVDNVKLVDNANAEIEELHNVKSALIDIEMYISGLEIWCKCFPDFNFRMQSFYLAPRGIADSFAVCFRQSEQQIQFSPRTIYMDHHAPCLFAFTDDPVCLALIYTVLYSSA
jgi:hypothetical protein